MVEAYRTLEAELSYQLELVKKLLTGSDRIPFGKRDVHGERTKSGW
jgi:hypothetical protein